ncbi:MAG: hypothetical protein O2992_08095 [Gemmatimonadetes bacterium]|jgi:hypothetical protein|nr:hypothetical protein [Gemmatimonadota bacterium]
MKLVFLMYLEEDDAALQDMLRSQKVTTWSRVTLEGHATGTLGWYGDVAPYPSRMVFSVMPAPQAEQLMEAVANCTSCQDKAHPLRALQVDVERAVSSGSAPFFAA